jgi:hypothetical protein
MLQQHMTTGRIVLIVILSIMAIGLAVGVVLLGISMHLVREHDAALVAMHDISARSMGTSIDSALRSQIGASGPLQSAHDGSSIAAGIQGVGRGVIPASPVAPRAGGGTHAGPSMDRLTQILHPDLRNDSAELVNVARCLSMLETGTGTKQDKEQCSRYGLPDVDWRGKKPNLWQYT